MQKIKFFILVFLLISVVCFLAYANSLTNPFIWDDAGLVVGNTLIRSAQNLISSFTNDLFFGVASGSNFYRPLQTISYIVDYHFWQLNPFGYHLTNIFLQIGVAFLVFLLAFRLIACLPVALAASLFFALTPLNTESVTYISGRAELLLGFSLILALLLFIRSQEETGGYKKIFYLLSLLSFVCGLLAKEIALVFPFVICAYIFYYLPVKFKIKRDLIKTSAAYFAFSLGYLILRLSYFHFATLRPPLLASLPWFERVITIPKVIFTYLKLLILPTGLHMSWQLLPPQGRAEILVAIFILGVFIFSCWYFLVLRKNRAVAFLFFWALVFFLPQSGIFAINAFVAEHFIYLSAISFFIGLAAILNKFLRPKIFYLAVVLLCGSYVLLIWGRNIEWSRPIIFYENILKYSSQSFQAHNNLGLEYDRQGFFSQAEAEYKKALAIKPELIESRANLANLYFKLKRYPQAKLEYELLLHSPLGAKAGEVWNNLGNVYEATGDLNEAMSKYLQALKLDPNLKFTDFNLARIYYSRKQSLLALEYILDSLGIPKNLESRSAMIVSNFMQNAGYFQGAAEFYTNLGVDFAKHKAWPSAINAFNCALELKPNSADLYFNLGLVYLNLGQKREEKRALKQALRIDPNHIQAKRLITQN